MQHRPNLDGSHMATLPELPEQLEMLQRSRWSWSHRCRLLARAFEDEHCHSNYSSFSGAVIVGIVFPVLWQRLLPLCCEVMPAQSNEARSCSDSSGGLLSS